MAVGALQALEPLRTFCYTWRSRARAAPESWASDVSLHFSLLHLLQVYLYEYNTLSKPVDKPRQCLPYATVTVRFLGQRAESGPTITSLRFLSAGFSKWPGKHGCSLVAFPLTTGHEPWGTLPEAGAGRVVLCLSQILFTNKPNT